MNGLTFVIFSHSRRLVYALPFCIFGSNAAIDESATAEDVVTTTGSEYFVIFVVVHLFFIDVWTFSLHRNCVTVIVVVFFSVFCSDMITSAIDNDESPTTSRCEYNLFINIFLLHFLSFIRLLLQSFVLWFIGRRNIGKYALHSTVRTQLYTAEPTDMDVFEYVHGNVDDVQRRLDAAIRIHRCIKWYATMDFSFQRTTPDDEVQHTRARFRTQPDVITDISCVTTEGIANEFLMGIENFNRRGSNWVVESVLDFV